MRKRAAILEHLLWAGGGHRVHFSHLDTQSSQLLWEVGEELAGETGPETLSTLPDVKPPG